MKRIIILVSLLLAHQANAGVYDFFSQFSLFNKVSQKIAEISPKQWAATIGLGFTGLFATYFAKKKVDQYQKNAIQKDFDDMINTLKNNVKNEQDIALKNLSEQLSAPEISPKFFVKSAEPNAKIENNNTVFDMIEVASALKNLKLRSPNQDQEEKSELKEKKPKPIERGITLLGKLPDYTLMDKYIISFSGFLTKNNNKAIRISFMERRLSEDHKFEDTYCVQNRSEAAVIGIQDSSGNFRWEKVNKLSTDFNKEVREVRLLRGINLMPNEYKTIYLGKKNKRKKVLFDEESLEEKKNLMKIKH